GCAQPRALRVEPSPVVPRRTPDMRRTFPTGPLASRDAGTKPHADRLRARAPRADPHKTGHWTNQNPATLTDHLLELGLVDHLRPVFFCGVELALSDLVSRDQVSRALLDRVMDGSARF